MSYEPFDTMLDHNPTPQEFIAQMFERTDEEGVLYIPASHTFTSIIEPWPDYDYRFVLDWNLSKYESVVKKFTKVYQTIKKIAPFEDELRHYPEKAKELLKDPELYSVWNAYVSRFDIEPFDFEKIMDISDRFEYIALTQEIAHRLSKGEKLNQYELEILEENLKTDVSEDEEKYIGEYHKLIEKQSGERIGGNFFAYETILFAQRVCRLIYLGAPEVIINNESRRFAESFVLHEYATSVKMASSTIRTQLEQIEQMSDDELDEYDEKRPQSNSIKSMLPLLVYQILQKHSSADKHLNQQKILELLKQPPYELKVERKALSRTLHSIENMYTFSVYHDKNGWWKE